MKKLKWFIFIIIVFTTSGCWQYRELNDISLVVAIGIDKEGTDYLVSTQVINLASIDQSGSVGKGGEPAVITFVSTGRSIKEALNKTVFDNPRAPYLGHLDLVMVGEEAARDGIKDFMDFLLRHRESRKMFHLVIAKETKASEALKVLTPVNKIPSLKIISSVIATHALSGNITPIVFDEILKCITQTARHAVAEAIELEGTVKDGESTDNITVTNPKSKVVLTGPAVFFKDKLVGFLTPTQGLGYSLLRERLKDFDIPFLCDDEGNYGTVSMYKPKLKFETIMKEGKPFADIKIDVMASLNEFNCKMDLEKLDNIEKIEKMINNSFKILMDDLINTGQKELKSDIFGFGEKLYRSNYKEWEKVGKDWDKIFPNMEYKTEVNTTLLEIQTFLNSTKEGIKRGKE